MQACLKSLKTKQIRDFSRIEMVDQIPRKKKSIKFYSESIERLTFTLYDLQTSPIRSFSACF
jgi:hypothetical protein